MCGRVAVDPDTGLVEFSYTRIRWPRGVRARYNIAPTDPLPVLRIRDGLPELELSHWWFAPVLQQRTGKRATFNARSEDVLRSPLFGPALTAGKRCVMPLTAFYEWQAFPAEERKRPHTIRRKDSSLLYVAGLWTIEKSREGGYVDSCAILTTSPNEIMAPLHNRMPVILVTRDERTQWLDPTTSAADAHRLLRPCDPGALVAYRVGAAVGNVRNDTAELLQPILP